MRLLSSVALKNDLYNIHAKLNRSHIFTKTVEYVLGLRVASVAQFEIVALQAFGFIYEIHIEFIFRIVLF